MIVSQEEIDCSIIRCRVPNKAHLTDRDIQNHPITYVDGKQIGRVLSVDNKYIYCIITEGEAVLKNLVICE